jgi:hypothetical protein
MMACHPHLVGRGTLCLAVAAACSVSAEENTLLVVVVLLQDGRLSMDELCVLVERMIKERERSM